MSNLGNSHVVLSNLGVKGPTDGEGKRGCRSLIGKREKKRGKKISVNVVKDWGGDRRRRIALREKRREKTLVR